MKVYPFSLEFWSQAAIQEIKKEGDLEMAISCSFSETGRSLRIISEYLLAIFRKSEGESLFPVESSSYI